MNHWGDQSSLSNFQNRFLSQYSSVESLFKPRVLIVHSAVLFTVLYYTCTVQFHEEDRGNVETRRRT